MGPRSGTHLDKLLELNPEGKEGSPFSCRGEAGAVQHQGSPSSGPRTSTPCRVSGSSGLEVKCTTTVMCLHPLETLPPSPPHPGSVEILSFVKSVACTEKGWGQLAGRWRL